MKPTLKLTLLEAEMLERAASNVLDWEDARAATFHTPAEQAAATRAHVKLNSYIREMTLEGTP